MLPVPFPRPSSSSRPPAQARRCFAPAGTPSLPRQSIAPVTSGASLFGTGPLTDVVTAIVDLLKADAGVAALVGTRVFGGELPPAEAASMPRNAIVIQPSGGTPFKPASLVKAEAQRLDVVAYGATPLEAASLRAVAGRVLVLTVRRLVSGVLVHWVQSAGGYLAGRDRDGQWPFAFQSFQALFSIDEVA